METKSAVPLDDVKGVPISDDSTVTPVKDAADTAGKARKKAVRATAAAAARGPGKRPRSAQVARGQGRTPSKAAPAVGVTSGDSSPPAELVAMGQLYATLISLPPTERARALAWTVDKLELDITMPSSSGQAAPSGPKVSGKGSRTGSTASGAGPEPATGDGKALKEFLARHKAKTDVDRLMCAAEFLFQQGRQAVKTRDITNAYKATGEKKLSNTSATVAQALKRRLLLGDAKNLRMAPGGAALLRELSGERAAAKPVKKKARRKAPRKATPKRKKKKKAITKKKGAKK